MPYQGKHLFHEALDQFIKGITVGKVLLLQWKDPKSPSSGAPSSFKHGAPVCSNQASTSKPRFSPSFQLKVWSTKIPLSTPQKWNGTHTPKSAGRLFKFACQSIGGLKRVQNRVQNTTPSLFSSRTVGICRMLWTIFCLNGVVVPIPP